MRLVAFRKRLINSEKRKEKKMRIQKALKILGYGSIIEGIISSVILFITTIMDEDLGALGIIGTLCFSLQITFFSIMAGFICLAISELFSQKKNRQLREDGNI